MPLRSHIDLCAETVQFSSLSLKPNSIEKDEFIFMQSRCLKHFCEWNSVRYYYFSAALLHVYKIQFTAVPSQWTSGDGFLTDSLKPLSDALLPQSGLVFFQRAAHLKATQAFSGLSAALLSLSFLLLQFGEIILLLLCW